MRRRTILCFSIVLVIFTINIILFRPLFTKLIITSIISGPDACASRLSFNESEADVCKETNRLKHWGLVDYVRWDGDPELKQLVQPLFKKKPLVVWHLDLHTGPVADIRALIGPLGVEVVEHTEFPPPKCNFPRCMCSQSEKISPYIPHNPVRPSKELYEKVATDPLAAPDIARADAFLITCTTPLVELYMRYNRSIIVAQAIRYEYTAYGDLNKWREMNERIRAIYKHRQHVIGANSLFDVEYMHYFTGVRPDYIPSFCPYTGAHYQPVRKSFLYARRHKVHQIGSFWAEQFDREYYRIRATFSITQMMDLYDCGYFFSDLAKHLGIVHLPYQVLFIN